MSVAFRDLLKLGVYLMLSTAALSAAPSDIKSYDHGVNPVYEEKRYPVKRATWSVFGGATFPHHSGQGLSVSSGLGWTGGLSLNFWFARKWGLSIGAQYIRKDFKLSGSNVALGYLEIPLELRFRPEKWLVFQLGPYFGAAVLEARQTVGGVSTDVSNSYSEDYGAMAGVLIRMKLSRTMHLGLNLRYEFGLVDIQNDSNISDSLKTRSLITTLGLEFRL